jgi:hypothetical protein
MHSPTGQVGGGAGDLFFLIFSAIAAFAGYRMDI